MPPLKIILKILFLILFVSSCTYGDKFQSNLEKNVNSNFLTKNKNISNLPPSDKWWLEFNDPLLNRLIDLGLENNQDIKIANLAIITARQLNNIDATNLFPKGSASIGRQRFASPGFGPKGVQYDIYQATFDATWELDFLGKNLDRYKAGKLRFLKQANLYKTNSLRLASEIAQNYFELKSLQNQLNILEKIVKIRSQLIVIANNKEQIGNADKTNIYNAKIALNSSQNLLIETKTNQKILTYKLAVLLGISPDEIAKIILPINKKPILAYNSGVVPIGLKSDILKRRPDIIAALYEIDAANFDQSAQFKEFFPSFNLTAKIGGGAKDLGEVLKNGSNVKDIRGGVSLPIFSYGSLIAEYKISKTKAKIAILDYEKTVIGALAECESQLIRYVNSLEIENYASDALKSSQEILRIIKNKKAVGAASSEDVLNNKIITLSHEIETVQKKSASLVNLIALHKAIGGGFEGFEMKFKKNRVLWVKNK
ncbi:MAG: TolC family protein [Rickettsiales bacterium]|nr:TolC family protein [Rickettsiales bacterium]